MKSWGKMGSTLCVTHVVNSKCKFPFIRENPPLIHYCVYYPLSKPACIYVSFKLVELPEITFHISPNSVSVFKLLFCHKQ